MSQDTKLKIRIVNHENEFLFHVEGTTAGRMLSDLQAILSSKIIDKFLLSPVSFISKKIFAFARTGWYFQVQKFSPHPTQKIDSFWATNSIDLCEVLSHFSKCKLLTFRILFIHIQSCITNHLLLKIHEKPSIYGKCKIISRSLENGVCSNK